MKRFCAIIIVLACAGCSDLGSFTVEETTAEVLVEGSSNPVNDLLPENVLPPLALDFDLQSELEERDASSASAVYLNALSLRVTDTAVAEGDTDDFDFLDRISFFAESRREGSELERVRLGTLDPVPEGRQTIDVEVDDTIDLKPYVEEGLRLTTSGSGSIPPDDVTIQGDVVIEVEVL